MRLQKVLTKRYRLLDSWVYHDFGAAVSRIYRVPSEAYSATAIDPWVYFAYIQDFGDTTARFGLTYYEIASPVSWRKNCLVCYSVPKMDILFSIPFADGG